MRVRRISERDAEAVLSGHAPPSRPELAPLAASIAEYRAAAYELPARPSVGLASRLGPLSGARSSSHAESLLADAERGKRFSVLSTFAGLGLAAKIALGTGAAVAAAAGAGAAGVLPSGAQEAFDTVVSTIVPGAYDPKFLDPVKDSGTDHGTNHGTKDGSDPGTNLGTTDGTHDGTATPEPASTDDPENFGAGVSERAKDPDKDGKTFGQETSKAAQENGHGNGNGNGKPDKP